MGGRGLRKEANQEREEPQSSTASSVCLRPFTVGRGGGRKGGGAGAGGLGGWLMDAPGYLEEGLLHSEAGQQN